MNKGNDKNKDRAKDNGKAKDNDRDNGKGEAHLNLCS